MGGGLTWHDEWLAAADGPATRCPRCSAIAAAAWLPSRTRPRLMWSLCGRCDRVSIWHGGRLDHPRGQETLTREQLRALALGFAGRAAVWQDGLVGQLADLRSSLTFEERRLAQVSRFLTTFLEYRLDSRHPSPATQVDISGRESVTGREAGRPMSDERVLQAAQADEAGTQRRIEELRQEIERAEGRLRDIGDFIRKYREYETANPESTP